MLFALNSFFSLLFLLFISISHQNAVDGPTWTTNISGGFATMFKKAEEMMDVASDYYQGISTTVGQSVITVGQSVIGQNAIESLDDINLLKPLIVQHFCNETIEVPKNDQFYQFHKELCVQLKEEDKSMEEALKNMQETVEKTFNAIDPIFIEELNQRIQNAPFLSAVNKKVLGLLLGQLKDTSDKLLPIINAVNRNCQPVFPYKKSNNNSSSSTRGNRRRAKRNDEEQQQQQQQQQQQDEQQQDGEYCCSIKCLQHFRVGSIVFFIICIICACTLLYYHHMLAGLICIFPFAIIALVAVVLAFKLKPA